MKDPASGPIAVIVLIVLLLLKWTLISSLLEKQLNSLLLIIPILGRLAIVILMTCSEYIKTDGLGSKLIQYLPMYAARNTILFCVLIAILILGVLPIISMFLVVFIVRYCANKRLGGVTGDVYGATVELVEVSILLSVVI
jgi:adenosylcobinamide-GDP ribazoletransferase